MSTQTIDRSAPHFRRADDGTTWLVEAASELLEPGELVGVERRDGSMSWVIVDEIVDKGTPHWSGGVEMATATTLRPCGWSKLEDDTWGVSIPPELVPTAQAGEPVLVCRRDGAGHHVIVADLVPGHSDGWMVGTVVEEAGDDG